jgi:hypothetical protein
MKIREIETGEDVSVQIEPFSEKDFKDIKKNRCQFPHFNWNKYKGKEVYKLHIKGDTTILGAMCMTQHNAEDGYDAIEIDLLEVSAGNVGANKKYENIAGCLIAFACKESFKRGHDGCVFLSPKTNLIHHYTSKYGMTHWPGGRNPHTGFMFIQGIEAHLLIQKYKV